MEILAQSSADFALTHNFQVTHILGASRGYFCDSVTTAFLYAIGNNSTASPTTTSYFFLEGAEPFLVEKDFDSDPKTAPPTWPNRMLSTN